jgi:hypothetical protein
MIPVRFITPRPQDKTGRSRFGCNFEIVTPPYVSLASGQYGPVWFGFFLNSFSEKLDVGKSWLWGKADG